MVLRFVLPKHYGIVSPPVEKILGIGPKRRQNDRYRQYVDSLRKLRCCRKFQTAAEVDMALWALQVGVLDGGLLKRHGEHGGKAAEIDRAFKKDVRLRQLRARNLIKPLFGELSKLQLAEALLPTDKEIAAQLAGIEFEQLIRRRSERNSVRHTSQREPCCACCDVIEVDVDLSKLLRNKHSQFGATHRDLDCARVIRNVAIHDPSKLTRECVQKLINVAKEVEGRAR